jgi:hypothetical protein
METVSLTRELSSWKGLYRVGGIAALTIVAVMPIQMAVFFLWPPPSTVIGWFTLFQNNALVGMLDMDLLLIVDYILMIVVFLALGAALSRFNKSFVAIALTLELVAIAAYLASAAAFEMLSLSNQYYAASTTDAEKSVLLAAGHAVLATWQGTAFDVSYVLGAVALLIVSLVMRRSQIFSKPTAYSGISAAVLTFIPSTAGTIGLFLSIMSLVPTVIWLVLTGRQLVFKLGHMQPGLYHKPSQNP